MEKPDNPDVWFFLSDVMNDRTQTTGHETSLRETIIIVDCQESNSTTWNSRSSSAIDTVTVIERL